MYKRKPGISAVVFTALMSLVVLQSCSSSNDDDNSNSTSMEGSDDGDSNGNNGGNNGGNNTAAFDGNWTIPCEGDFGSFEVVNISINGATATSDEFSYTDENCMQPDDPAVFNTTFSLVYPGGTTTTPQGEATHVNITAESITIDGAQPSAEELAEFQADGAFDTEYDLILLSGINLIFGEYTTDLDGTTAAKRPVTLDPDFIAIRQ